MGVLRIVKDVVGSDAAARTMLHSIAGAFNNILKLPVEFDSFASTELTATLVLVRHGEAIHNPFVDLILFEQF